MSKIVIERGGNKSFFVSVVNPGYGMRGYTVRADNLKGVHDCIEHFHGEGVFAKGNNAAHASSKKKNCPMCKQEREWVKQGKEHKCYE